MIIDFHTHIFPKTIRNKRDTFFINEPAFELLYNSPKSRLVSVDDLIAIMDEQGVDKAVTFGFPWQTADYFKLHNDYILAAVSRYPDRLIGFCCLDPMHPQAPVEAERCLKAGLSGIGELAFYCNDFGCASLKSLEPIMALSRQYNCPVMIHTNEPVGHPYPGKTNNTLAQIYAMVKQYPLNKLVLAHWGGGLFFYNLLKKEVPQVLANVWFDTAASPFLYRPDIYTQALNLAGPEKILLGTDFPLLEPKRYFTEMQGVELSEEHKHRINGGNAAALLGLGN